LVPASSASASESSSASCTPNTIWHGVLIEANQERFHKLKALHDPLGIAVSVTNPENGVEWILRNNVNNNINNTMMKMIPRQLDLAEKSNDVIIDFDESQKYHKSSPHINSEIVTDAVAVEATERSSSSSSSPSPSTSCHHHPY
jgi:hypothetical protein